MTVGTTLIRVPSPVRDRIRAVAQAGDMTFGQVISHGLDLIDQERFWSRVATLQPDQAYREEFAAWDDETLES